MAEAIDEQSRLLNAPHEWGPEAAGPPAGQVGALKKARRQWTAASEADDADTFHAHCERGSALLEGAKAVTARKALGPAATPPAFGDGYGGGARDV